MHSPVIIGTVGSSFNHESDFTLFDRLAACEVKTLRFNLSKFSDFQSCSDRVSFIRDIKDRYGSRFEILVDLPYPGKKPRLFSNQLHGIEAGKQFVVSSLFNEEVAAAIDLCNIGERVKVNELLIYSDGIGCLVVREIIDTNHIRVEALDSFDFQNRKSILFSNCITISSPSDDYIRLVQDLMPDKIALSFVSNMQEVFEYSSWFGRERIVSKIETKVGVDNTEEIASQSDIMLGRGDLQFFSDYNELFLTQQIVASETEKQNSKLYIATGFLSSLAHTRFPAPSEAIDVWQALRLNPYAIVLNSGVLYGYFEEAIQIINSIVDKLVF